MRLVYPLCAKSLQRRSKQHSAVAGSPKLRIDDQMVDQASPPVMSAQDGACNDTVNPDHKAQARIAPEGTCNALVSIS
ncbi:hypothetical protein ROSA5918_11085 [Roseateles saccharophilus]|uniref:Uncharacterized protein n=1 Tax=Roseateles saccharophilus TaxID=304 RepID=A0A4R3UP97_ROSSA|nr:hypothetical protein EV671_102265 [Roseateles saccharophilus]